ncbi:MAG TPA: hypothetical protein VMY06_02595 [Sedimentisphaerales bacterium]|nr:hypothetical protein [Sedimentisphaerales bacterium]
MSEKKKFKGPWIQRAFIMLLGVVLAVLLYWLLGFITKDIGSLRGPDFSKVQAEYVDAQLVKKQEDLKESLEGIRENIRNKREQQSILRDSTDSLQNTINQLLSIQKQSIERNLDFSEENQRNLTESQTVFLENQRQYLALNKEIAEQTSQQHQVKKEENSVSKQLKTQRNLASSKYSGLMTRHRWKLAALKLAVLIPIFLITAWFFTKKRTGAYWPVVYAAFIAAFVRISLIVHEYFPKKYFKYIALAVIIAIVLRLLVYMIKRIVSPKKDWILKQYQEAYDKALCPICGKPIRVGPLRYAVGRKRKAFILAGQGAEVTKQQLYTCPSCGTELYGKCDKCSNIRHSLLPFCEHCGNEKPD